MSQGGASRVEGDLKGGAADQLPGPKIPQDDWRALSAAIARKVGSKSWGLPRDAPEEIAQETLLRLWRKLGEEPEAFGPGEWGDIVRMAYAIATNVFLEHCRSARKYEAIEDQAPGWDPA